MTNQERKILADKIARRIFQVGDEPKNPCTRIQFKAGEKSKGGLCEEALMDIILKTLMAEVA